MRLIFVTSGLFLAILFATPLLAATLVLDESTPKQVIESIEKMKVKVDELNGETVKRQFLSDAQALTEQLLELKSFDGLSEQKSVKIVNNYESLRTRAEGGIAKTERRICERVKRTGTHMPTTVCLTQAERDRNAASAREGMTEIQRRSPSKSDGSQ